MYIQCYFIYKNKKHPLVIFPEVILIFLLLVYFNSKVKHIKEGDAFMLMELLGFFDTEPLKIDMKSA